MHIGGLDCIAFEFIIILSLQIWMKSGVWSRAYIAETITQTAPKRNEILIWLLQSFVILFTVGQVVGEWESAVAVEYGSS